MNIQNLHIDAADLRKLFGTASGDAALLYLYIRSGNDSKKALEELHFTSTRLSCAEATLRQLGLWPEEAAPVILTGERPRYSEKDVLEAVEKEEAFRLLRGEVQRLLGRVLNTEDLKILLSFIHYLGLPTEVIAVIVTFCKDRARMRGNLRAPSLRTIEKEAYHWAEQGIDTLEAAAAYIQLQNHRSSQLHLLMDILQIRGRNLTPAEEKLANTWMEMDFPRDVIALAYERTCLNTGGMNWAYMNKILTRWQEAGFKTVAQVQAGDRKTPGKPSVRQLDADEQAAIAKLLQEV
ncbi:MAG: DnaD domain protein [Ruminococcaceae bacterium]|nr:DnaD domain protein [Oscillospiraceae bacterium]